MANSYLTLMQLKRVRGVLSQVQERRKRSLHMAVFPYKIPRENNCTTHKELLSIVTFWQHFRKYLFGPKFLLRTST